MNAFKQAEQAELAAMKEARIKQKSSDKKVFCFYSILIMYVISTKE